MKTQDVVTIGVFAAIGYFVWKGFNSVNAAADAVSADLANFWVGLTSGPTVASQLQGNVILPDGTSFPNSLLPNYNPNFQGNVLMFTLPSGAQYSLAPHDANGNYVATRI